MGDVFLAFLCGSVSGGVTALAVFWRLSAKTSQLQFDVLALQERLFVEMKKRASHAARSAREFDERVIDAAKVAPAEPARQKNWWEILPAMNRN